MKHQIAKYIREEGASLLEYSILVALISVIAMAGITAFGENVSEKFAKQAGQIERAGIEGPGMCANGPDGSPECPCPPGGCG